jgi:hypothetical protein
VTENSAEYQTQTPATVVRLWSPLAVALYGLLLGFPAAVVPAFRNWAALGLWREASGHLVGALLLSLPFIGMSVFSPPRTVRAFGLVTNIAIFIYLKAKLRSDIEEVRKTDPSVVIDYRPWYSGAGWAVLGLLGFLWLYLRTVLVLAILDVPMPD